MPGTEDDDLRLGPGSPCIDAGNNRAVPADTLDLDGDGDTAEPIPFDLDGDPRFVDDPSAADCPQPGADCGTPPIVDMGAYEYRPDCNTNGVPDDCEPDFDGDGLIDVCDPDIDNDGVPNEEDACDLTPAGANIVADPESPWYGTLRGDLDGDCDCDLEDYAILAQGFTGPNG